MRPAKIVHAQNRYKREGRDSLFVAERRMKPKLVVVKVGTSSLSRQDGSLDLETMESIVDQTARATDKGYRVVLVTSGAVASGMAEPGL